MREVPHSLLLGVQLMRLMPVFDDDVECSDVFKSVRQAHGARASCETGPERL